ncbi:MAG TPA: DUF885 family protein [Actinomycetes bacterium]|jgi:hypothetical protein|nr:DUF885 family protein [Actinomycetes bacterium]
MLPLRWHVSLLAWSATAKDSINLPTSYLVGCLELERLRAASQTRLGDAFRLRRFHDRVLSFGHMPPTLVARAIAADDETEQRRPEEA